MTLTEQEPITQTRAVYTVDSIPEDAGAQPWEIWEGELVSMTFPSPFHNDIAMRIAFIFLEFCKTRPGLYYSGSASGYVVQHQPLSLLSPDAALFRLGPERKTAKWFWFAPEVAVEILSPSDSAAEMATKRSKYFRGGTEQVWVVSPRERTLAIHFSDNRVFTISRGALTGEGILYGLTLDVGALFNDSPFAGEETPGE